MPVPPFQEITLPLLKLAADEKTWSLAEARQELAKHFQLTLEEQEELLPSGKQARFSNRVAWAKVYLQRAGLLDSPDRGMFRITQRGKEVLTDPPPVISVKFLTSFPDFQDFQSKSESNGQSATDSEETETPEEVLESAYKTIRKNLASELLEKVKSCSPRFFEQLVIELLFNMGYGRAGGGLGEHVGAAGDEGIDGVISEDRLGLEMVYLQAKRWEGTVGRPEIQKFVGALHGRRARKGVFITTSAFSAEALNYVQSIDPRVALVDGKQLAEYMIDFGLGVSSARNYEVKRVDSDYFEE